MQEDFFQVLRRVQKEERNKSSLARVENDFYKQLRDYIRNLERSVASDPFGNEQLLLNNAQRIATEICELRESKITKAANNNIYRSFLLFKKDNPQFDLLDTTPLNLTDEEETLYFSLMDALKNHRYKISLDEYAEEKSVEETEEDFDEDEETAFVEDSYSSSVEKESSIGDDLEDEISTALGEESNLIGSVEGSSNAMGTAVGGSSNAMGTDFEKSPIEEEAVGLNSSSDVQEEDEVLSRLNQIKDAKIITDEKYETIDRQIANQNTHGVPDNQEQNEGAQTGQYSQITHAHSGDSQSGQYSQITHAHSGDSQSGQYSQITQDQKSELQSMGQNVQGHQSELQSKSQAAQGNQSELQSKSQNAQNQESDQSKEEKSKGKSFDSDNINDIFKDPDSQFVDINKLEPNYEDAYYDSIVTGSKFAAPSDDDFNLIFAKPKKPKSDIESNKIKSDIKSNDTKSDIGANESKSGIKSNETISDEIKKPAIELEPAKDDLGFSSGLDVKESKVPRKEDFTKAVEEPKNDAPKKPVDKTRGGLFKREEIENTTVVISENTGEMVGIDGKVYGPFLENDVVILPHITAQILIDNNKASLVKL